MKRKIIISVLLTLLLIPFKGNAATGNLNISCGDAKVKAGEIATCTITGNIDTVIDSIEADISLSDNLTFVSYTSNNLWSSEDASNGKIEVYPQSGDEVTGNFTIGELKVKVKSGIKNTDETVTISNIKFYSNKEYYNINNDYDTIRVPNNVNTLKSLSIDGLTISPTFSSGTTSYSASTTTNSIKINASATDSNATISGIGTQTLKNGKNTFNIVVTAEDSSTKKYTITVNASINNSTSSSDTSTNDNNETESGNSSLSPSSSPSSGQSNTNTNEIDDEPVSNISTGDSTIIIAIILSFIMLGCMLYIFKIIQRGKNNTKKEN